MCKPAWPLLNAGRSAFSILLSKMIYEWGRSGPVAAGLPLKKFGCRYHREDDGVPLTKGDIAILTFLPL